MSEIVQGTKKTWLELLSERAVENTFKAFDSKAEAHGDEFVNDLYIKFIENYIGYLVYQALNIEVPKGMDKEQFVLENFAACKMRVQDAVAAGYGAAMTAYTKKPVDYYCQVKIMPPVANKEPC